MRPTFTEQLQPIRDQLRRQGPAIRPVVSITAGLAGETRYAVGEARAATLRWLEKKVGPLPPEAWSGEDFEHMSPGRFTAAVKVTLADGFYWALRCDDPDKHVPGRTWTTEVSIATAGGTSTFGIRLVVSVADGMPDYTPSVPSFVRRIVGNPGLIRNGRHLSLEPIVIDGAEKLDQFIALLVDQRRRNPIFAIALDENQDALASAAVNARALADRCIGLAHVAVITGEQAFELTRQVGKTLSVFRRAVRTYRPQFTFDDDPYRHPLALPAQIESWHGVGVSAFENTLIEAAASNSIRLHDDPNDFLPFTKVKQVALQARRSGSVDLDFPALVALAEQELAEKQRDIEALESLLNESEDSKQHQSDRVSELEAVNAFLRNRVVQLEQLASRTASQPVTEYPSTYEDVPDWVEKHLGGRVVLTPRAQREVKNAAFADIELVCRCLKYLGEEFRRMKMEGGSDLVKLNEDKLYELGIRNEQSGAEHLLKEQGDTFFVTWGSQGRRRLLGVHLKNGGNTRDPERCLRVYYFWDEDTQQIVVGSLPAHLNTRAS